MALQLTFTSGRCLAGAAVVYSSGHQLLAGPGLSTDQDGGVGGGDLLNLAQQCQKARAGTHDFRKIVLGLDFFLQIDIGKVQFAERRFSSLPFIDVAENEGK